MSSVIALFKAFSVFSFAVASSIFSVMLNFLSIMFRFFSVISKTFCDSFAFKSCKSFFITFLWSLLLLLLLFSFFSLVIMIAAICLFSGFTPKRFIAFPIWRCPEV